MCEHIEMILVVEVGEVILVVVVFVEIEIVGVDQVAVPVLVSIVRVCTVHTVYAIDIKVDHGVVLYLHTVCTYGM